MDWKKTYESRLTSPEEAVKLIKSGDKVVFAHDVSEPPILVDALCKNAASYKNVEISHMFTLGTGEYAKPEYKENFHINSWFVSGPIRGALDAGYGDYTPAFFHEVPALMRKGIITVDVAMIMVTPPDENGKVSTGLAADYTVQAVKSAKTVIAQVNENLPFTYGDCVFDVEEIDAFVIGNTPLPILPPAKIGETEEAIGKYCASLVEDGATLQLGIGAIPDAVLHQLKDKKHLGIHSEMLSDTVVDLVELGVIDGSEKSINKGKIVINFVMGGQKLYDFLDRNESVLLMAVDYVNHPMVVAQNSKMVSINAALAIDFFGQVAADTIGLRQFSGVGGQVDFIRGCAMATDGKGISIIAMPSVTVKKDGSMISKISPYLSEGTCVTTSRHDVDYVVTEYGIAHLKGKTVKDRARALINIAHPNFRDELKAEFEKMFKSEF